MHSNPDANDAPSAPHPEEPESRWRSRAFYKRMLICIGLGFSSGLPLYVLYQMIPAWLRSEGVDLATIGVLSLVSLPYTLKFLWSPLLDRFDPIGLGRRRSWTLLTQVGLLGALAAFSLTSPEFSIAAISGICFVVSVFSATQDIALDAYRRELLPDRELGLGNSLAVNAYRIASLVPGSLALILADTLPWRAVHLVVAAFMLVGILTSLWMPRQPVPAAPTTSLAGTIVVAVRSFVDRRGLGASIAILAFMLLYKLGDSMATALATPFYLDMGFSMTQVGTIAKVASLWASVFGGTVGGIIMVWIGINRALWLFGAVQLLSILGFAALSVAGDDPAVLFGVVSFEYLGVGLGTAAFVAFIAHNTDPRYTAFQFAVLTAITGIPRTFAGATTGYLVEWFGYTSFFLGCFALAIPGMLMLPLVAPWGDDPPDPNAVPSTAAASVR